MCARCGQNAQNGGVWEGVWKFKVSSHCLWTHPKTKSAAAFAAVMPTDSFYLLHKPRIVYINEHQLLSRTVSFTFSQSTHLTSKSISRKAVASQTQTTGWIKEHRARSHLKVDTFDDCSTFGTERMSISVSKAVINTFTWIKIPFSSQIKSNLCRFRCLKCEDLLLFLC